MYLTVLTSGILFQFTKNKKSIEGKRVSFMIKNRNKLNLRYLLRYYYVELVMAILYASARPSPFSQLFMGGGLFFTPPSLILFCGNHTGPRRGEGNSCGGET
jgi:hypothetical protein